jgi:hypothetical protein
MTKCRKKEQRNITDQRKILTLYKMTKGWNYHCFSLLYGTNQRWEQPNELSQGRHVRMELVNLVPFEDSTLKSCNLAI